MKAPVFKGVGKPLAIESLPDPTPGEGDIVVKVARCGICGTDLHMTDGHAHTFPEGTILGHEFAGEIVAVGPGVSGFAVGDVVTAMPTVGCGKCANCLAGENAWCSQGLIGLLGGFGQYVSTKAHAAMKLPKSLSMDDGALVEPLAVGLHGVALAQAAPGARVLVMGAGPIGLAAAFWARKLGAGRVVVTSRSRRGEAIAMQMGATAFVQSGPEMQAEIERALGGMPDVVYECIGVPGMVMQAAGLVRPRGTVMVLGNCMAPDTVYPSLLMFKQIRLQGSMVYSLQEFETVANALDAGHVEARAMITDAVGYDALPETFEALRKPAHQCKVMIRPWG